MEGGAGSLVKWNPVANVEGRDIWNFLRTMAVPVNSLHSQVILISPTSTPYGASDRPAFLLLIGAALPLQGYISIGCEPCTRPVLPGQHEREGRWWWEDAKAKECGLHKGNIKQDEALQPSNGNGTAAAAADGPVDIFTTQAVVPLSRPGIENLVRLENRKEPWLVVLYAPWCRFCQVKIWTSVSAASAPTVRLLPSLPEPVPSPSACRGWRSPSRG